MRVWIINQFAAPPTIGGFSRHHSMGKALIRKGHQVTIWAANYSHMERRHYNPESLPDTMDGIKYRWIAGAPYGAGTVGRFAGMQRFTWMLRRATRSEQSPDVVIGSSPHPWQALEASKIARRHRASFVYEVRDLWPETLVQLGNVSPRHPLVLWLLRIQRTLLQTASSVITALPGSTLYLIDHGAPRRRLFVIPNGIDLAHAPKPSPPAIKRGLVIAYAGSMGTANAVPCIVRAAVTAMERSPKISSAVFYGDGPDRHLLAQEYSHLSNSVRFPGFVPRSSIVERLQEADILVATTPSKDLYAHGISPNKLLDYLASGRPIVFGNESPDDPIRDAEAGVIVKPEDVSALANGIIKMAETNPAERLRLGQNGRRFVEEKFDWDILGQHFAAIIEQTVKT